MNVCVIDYNAGNTASVRNALNRLGVSCKVSSYAEEITAASHVIFPGVGNAAAAMAALRAGELDSVIKSLRQPVLGICLGLQLLCMWSEEGDTKGLGVFSEEVRRLNDSPKVPHMGWNQAQPCGHSILLQSTQYFYFVHSYAAAIGDHTRGRSQYGPCFSACLERDNFFGVQFHPEKSGAGGERLLRRFLSL